MLGLQVNARLVATQHPRNLRLHEKDRVFIDAIGIVFYCEPFGGASQSQASTLVLSPVQCEGSDTACILGNGRDPYIAVDNPAYYDTMCQGALSLSKVAGSYVQLDTPVMTVDVHVRAARSRFDSDRTLHLNVEFTPKQQLMWEGASGVLGETLDYPCYGVGHSPNTLWPQHLSGGWRLYRVIGDDLRASDFLQGSKV